MVVHEADSYSNGGVTIEVNGGARGERDSSSSGGPGVAGIGGQIQLIPSVSVTSPILFVVTTSIMLSYIYIPTNHPFLSLLL